MSKAVSNIKEFAIIAFTLLGVLFGMMIMTFIFGQLGPTTSTYPDTTVTGINLTGAYINQTGYTIPNATLSNFDGSFTVIHAYNYSDGSAIPSSDYSVNAATGTITNATNTNYANVSLTYSYSQKTDARLASQSVQNNSLQAINTYSSGAKTQFSTLSIAIVLVVLIAVFLLFWKIFVANSEKKRRSRETDMFR